jgi:hypothetical protein
MTYSSTKLAFVAVAIAGMLTASMPTASAQDKPPPPPACRRVSAGRSSSCACSTENEEGLWSGPCELLPGSEGQRGEEVLALPPHGVVAFMREILQGSARRSQGKSHGRTAAWEPAAWEPAPRCAA